MPRRPSSSRRRTSSPRRRPAGESFGIVLLEAMAAGTPIVASDIHGYKGVVRRGPRGPARAAAGARVSLAAAIERLLHRPGSLRAEMKRRRARPRRGVQLATRDGQGRRLLRVRTPLLPRPGATCRPDFRAPRSSRRPRPGPSLRPLSRRRRPVASRRGRCRAPTRPALEAPRSRPSRPRRGKVTRDGHPPEQRAVGLKKRRVARSAPRSRVTGNWKAYR